MIYILIIVIAIGVLVVTVSKRREIKIVVHKQYSKFGFGRKMRAYKEEYKTSIFNKDTHLIPYTLESILSNAVKLRNHFTYVADKKDHYGALEGKDDRWEGDCEDFSLLFLEVYRPVNTKLVLGFVEIVKVEGNQILQSEGHCWLELDTPTGPVLVDNNGNRVLGKREYPVDRDGSYISRYIPLEHYSYENIKAV